MATTTTVAAGASPPSEQTTQAPPPPEFVCPITLDVMRDPVVLEPDPGHGHAFERLALTEWLNEHPCHDPLTNVRTPGAPLRCRPHADLRAQITAYRRARGDTNWRRVGDAVDAVVGTGKGTKWVSGSIVAVLAGPPVRVRVHFHRYAPKWDEWYDEDSARLAHPGTKTQTTQKQRVGAALSSSSSSSSESCSQRSSPPHPPAAASVSRRPASSSSSSSSSPESSSSSSSSNDDARSGGAATLAELETRLSSTGVEFTKYCRAGTPHARYLFVNADQGTVWWHNRRYSVGGPDYSKLFFLKDVRAIRHGADFDSDFPLSDHPGSGASGRNLRKNGKPFLAWCRNGNQDRAFSLVFPTRTLDGGCATPLDCRVLVAAFRLFVHRAKANHALNPTAISPASWYNIVIS